jgi:hypothetical protein
VVGDFPPFPPHLVSIWGRETKCFRMIGLKLANQTLLIPLGGALPDKDDHAGFLGN